jgi:hyperosmotically inducible periplasmic protein
MNKRTRWLHFAAPIAATLAVTAGVGSCSQSPDVAATLPATTAAAGNVSDSDVTNNVRTALLQNESLKGFSISVVTLKGDVRLIGTLDSQSQIDEAIRIAHAADGAHSIHNELAIRK